MKDAMMDDYGKTVGHAATASRKDKAVKRKLSSVDITPADNGGVTVRVSRNRGGPETPYEEPQTLVFESPGDAVARIRELLEDA